MLNLIQKDFTDNSLNFVVFIYFCELLTKLEIRWINELKKKSKSSKII